MTTKVTSAKEQGNETLETIALQVMRIRDAAAQYSHVIVMVLTVLIYSVCEESLRLLWTMKVLHPGVALLCAVTLFIGRRTR